MSHRTMTAEYKLDTSLNNHKQWVATNGKEGTQLDVGMNRVPGQDVWVHDLKCHIGWIAKLLSIELTNNELDQINFKKVMITDSLIFDYVEKLNRKMTDEEN